VNNFNLPPGVSENDIESFIGADEMAFEYCPTCAGELDTGWECNDCGRDWRPWAMFYPETAEAGREQ